MNNFYLSNNKSDILQLNKVVVEANTTQYYTYTTNGEEQIYINAVIQSGDKYTGTLSKRKNVYLSYIPEVKSVAGTPAYLTYCVDGEDIIFKDKYIYHSNSNTYTARINDISFEETEIHLIAEE